MEYDFSNGPMAIDSIHHFSGVVGQRTQVIDGFLRDIIKEKKQQSDKFIGDNIKKFSKLYPEKKGLIFDMYFLNKIRVSLLHGNPCRDAPESSLYCIHPHTKEKILITNELVDEFNKKYLNICKMLIEIKRSNK